MGNLCARRVKRNDDEVSPTVDSGENTTLLQRTQSLQEGGAVKKTTEQTLRKETDTTCKKIVDDYTVGEDDSPRPCSSQAHHSASPVTEEEEAAWVDGNRAELIQTITTVRVIADELFQQRMIIKETYNKILAAHISQDQMRELYEGLSSITAKSAFYRILKEIQPDKYHTEDVVKEVIRKHKAYLRKEFTYELEGTKEDHKDARSLDDIYTELHIIQGECEHVINEHEIWQIQDKERIQTSEGTKINCNNIFRSAPEHSVSSGQDRQEVREIRTVMTKGIAGIGKTVSVKKFILDWADGKANQDLDFIFVFPFRELNLVIDDQFSLVTLVQDFHPELKHVSVAKIFDKCKVLFIFDGLDESQLVLDFAGAKRLTDTTKEESVDTVVTNLIREHLLRYAFVWITSRPGAVKRIPRKYVYQWTEVRGFNDSQKLQYFWKSVQDKEVAEKIIDNITKSRSLFIMCHIPIFCWIAAKVLADLLPKQNNTQDENIMIPTTLTEMYTHFLCIQMKMGTEKYDNQYQSDTEEIFRANKEFILKLGRMAFELLKEGKITFKGSDLEKYGIDISKAGVYCGLCTEIIKVEKGHHTRKFYCFVHLTIQEYFAALFVYDSFARKKIDSQSLKDFLTTGSEEELMALLDADPVDLPLNELIEISIANSTQTKTGELDMFLRYLIGMSLQSTQELLQGLIQQTEEHTAIVEEIKTSLTEIDLLDCSPERCLNLVHCLIELKDSSLHETVQQHLKPNHNPAMQLSPVQCSALADSILMSNTPLDNFDLKKYRPSVKGIFRLIPAIRNSRKARISGLDLDEWICETISSALRMPNSVLTELHVTNSVFYEKGTKILIDVLENSQCELKALSLSGSAPSGQQCEQLASAIKLLFSHLKELELSGCVMRGWLCSVFSDGLGSLEKLRLNRNHPTAICKMLVTAFTSGPCCLRELELNYTGFEDSDMELLCTGLTSTNCNLCILSLSHNRLTEKGCRMLASALSSKPSNLMELDLSYNDLQDSGVMVLCNALMNLRSALKVLRLSFCKVTRDGCAALASALRSDHCSLRELDLSFNHLHDDGVEMLNEILKDSHCNLETLNVDQNEEYWFDLKLLRQYACDLTLDPNTASVNIVLTDENKKATYVIEKQSYPEHPERFHSYQVLCEEGLTGRHYWEVECVSADVGVAYKSMDRTGDCSSEFKLGGNEKSWCWLLEGSFQHNKSYLQFLDRTGSVMGVFLDWPAGILTFCEVLSDSVTHLYTVSTTFTEPLHPGFFLDPVTSSEIHIRKIN